VAGENVGFGFHFLDGRHGTGVGEPGHPFLEEPGGG